jgi:CRP-like cAMP-binding protein
VAALQDSELLVLHRSDFLRFIHDHPSFSLALLADLARRLRGCLEEVETLGRQGAAARAAHGLLSLAGPAAIPGGGLTATLPFSQVEFAQLLHVTPENLSRALTKLRSEGLVERLGARRFRIPKPNELRRIGDGD